MTMGLGFKGAVLALLFTVLVAMVVLNAIKEDPVGADRDRRMWMFALGAGTYAAILLIAR